MLAGERVVSIQWEVLMINELGVFGFDRLAYLLPCIANVVASSLYAVLRAYFKPP
jgi:hypothetical protein